MLMKAGETVGHCEEHLYLAVHGLGMPRWRVRRQPLTVVTWAIYDAAESLRYIGRAAVAAYAEAIKRSS